MSNPSTGRFRITGFNAKRHFENGRIGNNKFAWTGPRIFLLFQPSRISRHNFRSAHIRPVLLPHDDDEASEWVADSRKWLADGDPSVNRYAPRFLLSPNRRTFGMGETNETFILRRWKMFPPGNKLRNSRPLLDADGIIREWRLWNAASSRPTICACRGSGLCNPWPST